MKKMKTKRICLVFDGNEPCCVDEDGHLYISRLARSRVKACFQSTAQAEKVITQNQYKQIQDKMPVNNDYWTLEVEIYVP